MLHAFPRSCIPKVTFTFLFAQVFLKLKRMSFIKSTFSFSVIHNIKCQEKPQDWCTGLKQTPPSVWLAALLSAVDSCIKMRMAQHDCSGWMG